MAAWSEEERVEGNRHDADHGGLHLFQLAFDGEHYGEG